MRASALGGGAGRISIGRPIGIGGIHWDSHCWRPMSVVSEASAMKLRWFCTCAPPACSSRRKRSSEDCKRRRKPAIFAGACDRASWATLNNSGAVHHRSRVTWDKHTHTRTSTHSHRALTQAHPLHYHQYYGPSPYHPPLKPTKSQQPRPPPPPQTRYWKKRTPNRKRS